MNADLPDHTESSIIATLDSAFSPTPVHLDSLAADLAARAEVEGVLDVGIGYVESPFGLLLIAVSDIGVVRVAFANENHDSVLTDLARTVSPRILEAPARIEHVARQLDEYFAGQRQAFDLAIDLRLLHGFRREVVHHLSEIPYGSTASYAQLAEIVGNPRAVRAVGSACSHNPVPILLPCHRVVRSDGGIGNYLGGTDAKRSLLALEAA